jgi:gluconate 2-dehydrogenase gamma chain
MIDLQDRRRFLRVAMASGAAWAAADLGQVEAALAWADEQQHAQHRQGAAATSDQTRFSALTKAQADAIEAMTSRILPAVDGRPGAREAGAVYFIDRALATFNAAQKAMYVAGVEDLDQRAAAKGPGQGFAALMPGQQDDLLREVERTPFFQTVRFDTLVGTFALPSWGGNKDFAGWKLLGVEHRPFFQAPFGYYDAEANSNSKPNANGKD